MFSLGEEEDVTKSGKMLRVAARALRMAARRLRVAARTLRMNARRLQIVARTLQMPARRLRMTVSLSQISVRALRIIAGVFRMRVSLLQAGEGALQTIARARRAGGSTVSLWGFPPQTPTSFSCLDTRKESKKVEAAAEAVHALFTLCRFCSIARPRAHSSEQSMICFRPLPGCASSPLTPSPCTG